MKWLSTMPSFWKAAGRRHRRINSQIPSVVKKLKSHNHYRRFIAEMNYVPLPCEKNLYFSRSWNLYETNCPDLRTGCVEIYLLHRRISFSLYCCFLRKTWRLILNMKWDFITWLCTSAVLNKADNSRNVTTFSRLMTYIYIYIYIYVVPHR